MKTSLFFILLLALSSSLFSQQSDVIVLKKRNNRTIKTLFPGAFISAYTFDGFFINGFIKDIRNDSVYVRQEERRLVGTQFGSTLDTVAYTIGVDYRQIKQFNYGKKYVWGGKKGFVAIAAPRLMMICGTGYVFLELVNTIYRKESLTKDNKLTSLGIAAGVAVAGFAWKKIQDRRHEVGHIYKVVYVKKNTFFAPKL